MQVKRSTLNLLIIRRNGDAGTLRIGVFNPVLHRIGGAEYVTTVLINVLKEQGHQVVVMSNKKIDPTRTAFFFGKSFDIDAHITPLLDLPRWIPTTKNSIVDYTNALQSYVLKLNCQILIDTYTDFINPWNDITYFQERERNIFPRSAPSLSSFLHIPLFKSSLIEEKALLVVSRFLADFLEKKGVHCNVLYPPVNVSYFSYSNKRLCGSKEDIVVTFSRFSKEKKLENIPVIAKQAVKGISFVIAGSCQTVSSYRVLQSLRELVKKLEVADRVKLLPNISRERVRKLLWSSKVYLHTRENEPFGITIVEAMSSGCIPIVHDSGGPREFVPEYHRYTTIEEALMKIEKAVVEWSLEKSDRMSSIADRFSEKEFSKRFLDVLNLYIKSRFQK